MQTSPTRPSTEPPSEIERIASRAQRNLAFRVQLWPEPKTAPGQIEGALARMRSAIQRRKAQAT